MTVARAIAVTLGLAIQTSLGSGTSLAADPAGLDITPVELRGAKGDAVCIISVSNRWTTSPLAKFQLWAVDGLGSYPLVGPVDLAAAQSIVVDWAPPHYSHCSGPGTVFKAKFERDGVSNALVLPSPQPAAEAPQPTSPLVIALASSVTSAAAVIVGAVLVHVFTASRERNKERTTFRTKRQETTEAAIKEFLAGWSETPLEARLQTHFGELRRKTTLPGAVVDLYQTTLALLADPAGSLQAKQEAARRLSRALTEFVEHYDPGPSG